MYIRFVVQKHIVLLLFCLSLVSGCKVQLAPTFNRDLITGIADANKEALALFSSIENGTTAATFNNREGKYNELIGSFEGLATQSNSRVMPNNKLAKFTNKFLDLLPSKGINLTPADKLSLSTGIPSAFALKTIAVTIKAMRDQDKAAGLTSAAVPAFKNPFDISVKQALIYENALER